MDALLLTYRSFMTPMDFFECLVNRYRFFFLSLGKNNWFKCWIN